MAHGHAFHAHEARHAELEKRAHFQKVDLGDGVDRYVHIAGGQALSNKDVFIGNAGKNEDVVTVISQVYVTEPKTFAGPAVYVTQTGNPNDKATPAAAATTPTHNSYESAKHAAQQPHTRENPHTTAHIVGYTPPASHANSIAKGTPLSVSGNDGVVTQKHQGMTGGAKAGLAIGILAIIGLVAGLALFCIRRRKKQLEENGERIDEKHASQNSFFSGTAAAVGAPAGEKRASIKSFGSTSSRTGATAPRLSLRPVASMFPGMMGGQSNTNSVNGPAMSERGQNPFSDAAMISEKQARSASPSANPFEDGRPTTPGSDAQVATAAAVPVAAGAAGGSPPRGPNNVHRVQLDFKPSMDDELELKSGQIVRMLHEYDDGWALCIRMDRTQQGVCPRTCLSKLPVKPRPPPQGGPQGRPMGPPPPGMRGPPPPGGNKMMPRPLTPNGRERSNTAGGRTSSPVYDTENRTRSQSVSAAEQRPVSPVETGVPARKPVPGQAM